MTSLTDEPRNVIYGLSCTCHPEKGVRYVGQTCRGASVRLRGHIYDSHRGKDRAIHNWMRKHGVENIVARVLEVADSRFALNALEIKWIAKLQDGNLLNMTDGGDSVQKLTSAQVRDIRQEYAAGAYQTALAAKFGVSQALVGNIVRGEYAGGENLANDGRGRRKPGSGLSGAGNPMSKLVATQVIEIRQRYATGEGMRDLAAFFGVSKSNIRMIVFGLSWKNTGETAVAA